MPLIVQANCNWQRVTDKRQQLESFRQTKIARLRSDIDKISKREMQYAKDLVDQIIPVKLVWDEEAWNRVKEFVPVRVVVKGEPVEVEIVPTDQSS